MQIVLKVAAALIVILFFLLGLAAYLNPAQIISDGAFAWTPDGIAGLSGARAVVGGHFLGLALITGYGFIKGNFKLFYVIAVTEFMIAVGRVLSLALDGYDERVVLPLVIEVVFASVAFSVARFTK